MSYNILYFYYLYIVEISVKFHKYLTNVIFFIKLVNLKFDFINMKS